MKIVRIALIFMGLMAVGIKLFTYEYFYADDPTSGIALRATPGLESRRRIQSQPGFERDRILIADENSFPGIGLYRSIVRGGWFVLPTLAGIVWVATRLRERH
ncbi:hypothetical protein [Stigmatella aurantiaca]|uniref:Uncharacterized protein n=1 Tax=Stigmatella aurantiaca (strain DW4/3-1) TaxID=378806 RepID=E3FPX8_STIAD|nr:hypothetical protein [Stigmatella aurantiaca]ADO75681.1 uncharacterized protein STAUR_7926 [Stigmatella aurantiaca DW4/3-1]